MLEKTSRRSWSKVMRRCLVILSFTVLAAGFALASAASEGQSVGPSGTQMDPPPIPTGKTADSATCLTERVSQQSVQMTDNSEGEHVSDSEMNEVQGGAK